MASLRPSPSAARSIVDRGRRRTPILVVALFGVVALGATACTGEPPEVTTDDPELVTGRAIYGASCASCHGADGGGGVGSRLQGAALAETYPDIEDQIDLVLNGRERMPAFIGRLDRDQVRAVVRYTREVL